MRRGLVLRLLVLAAVATFASHTLITPEMMALRERMPTIVDLVPRADPLRVEWGRLHGLSSIALLLRILSAAGIFAVSYSLAGGQRLVPVPGSGQV